MPVNVVAGQTTAVQVVIGAGKLVLKGKRSAEATDFDTAVDRVRAAGPTHLRGIEEHFLAKLTPVELEAIRAALDKVIPPQPAASPSNC